MAATSGPASTSMTRLETMTDGFMRGFGARDPVDDAEQGFQIGKGPRRLVAYLGEDVSGGARYHLDCLSTIGRGAGGAKIPLKVGEGGFHGNQTG